MGNLGFDLRPELVGGAAQFGEKLSGLTSHLRQLLRPKENESQEEQEDRVGKTHGHIIIDARGQMRQFDAALRSRLKDDRVALITCDDAIELSQVLGLIGRYAQLLHLKGA